MSLAFTPFVADANHSTFRDSQRLMAQNFTDPSATSMEFLRWLYLDNPFHKAIGYIAYEGETPVSQLFLTFQQCLYNGTPYTVAIASNACTAPTHRNQGLFHKIFSKLVQDATKMNLPFIWAYPNPSSLRGFLKTGFRVVETTSLEITPVSYLGMISEARKKEHFGVMGETQDLQVNLYALKHFGLITEAKDYPTPRDAVWEVPLTKEQIAWRYLCHPTRKYYGLEHKRSGTVFFLRFIKLFGMTTALIMKTSAKNPLEYNSALQDLREDLKNITSFFTTLPSQKTNPSWTNFSQGRFLIPQSLSPRKFPLAVFPLQEGLAPLNGAAYDFALGDYEAL